jgi:hypothetical protein
MSSWSSLYDCDCYQFIIIDSEKKVTITLDHRYHASVRLKGKADVMNFTKTIKMNAEYEHGISSWASENVGASDTEASGYSTPDFSNAGTVFIPWTIGNGFIGSPSFSQATVLNKGELLALASQTSSWIGTLSESLSTDYGTFDFSNIRLAANHILRDSKNVSATSTSNQPVGWANVAVGEGWQTRWIDNVGFRNHTVSGTSTTTDEVMIGDIVRSVSGEPQPISSSYNVIGRVTDYGGDIQNWQPVYPLNDPESDGWHLGWSHWMMENVVASRWTWLRDVVDTIIRGTYQVTGDDLALGGGVIESIVMPLPVYYITENVDYNGDWQGSVADSRMIGENTYLMGSSSNGSFLYKNPNMELLPLPTGVETPCHSICPI